MEVIGTDIYMIRGDSETVQVYYTDEGGNHVPFEAGDTVYFTVKESIHTEVILFQRIIKDFAEGYAIIDIRPADTKNLKFKDYVYDVQVSKVNGYVRTIVRPSKFVVQGEVTYD